MSFSEIMQSKTENGPKMDLLGPDCLNDKRPLKGPKELYDSEQPISQLPIL